MKNHDLEKIFSNINSNATKRAYQYDWMVFTNWCDKNTVRSLPSTGTVISNFLLEQAGLKTPSGSMPLSKKPSSLRRSLAAIQLVHLESGYVSPTKNKRVTRTYLRIKNELGHIPVQKEALQKHQLIQMLDLCDENTLGGYRDKALLILGFSAAFKQSEIVNLQAENLQFLQNHNKQLSGLLISITNKNEDILLTPTTNPKYCPINILKDYMEIAGIVKGAIFRRKYKNGRLGNKPLSGQAYIDILKKYAHYVGIDTRSVSGNSQQYGFIVNSILKGDDIAMIMKMTRHKSTGFIEKHMRVVGTY